MTRVALGFRAHSGWAAVVAVALADRQPEVLHRGRVELVPFQVHSPDWPLRRRDRIKGDLPSERLVQGVGTALVDRSVKGSVQPYHLARTMKLADAETFIRRATDATNKFALEAVRAIIADLAAKNHQVAACAVVLASGRPLPPLEATLRSHAMVHTAEGELFRGAIAHAGERCGLRVSGVKERELYEYAAEALHLPATKLKRRVTEMGKAVGSPWTSDEKNATLVAWLALAGRA
jgi:hypothetical protein